MEIDKHTYVRILVLENFMCDLSNMKVMELTTL